jgi:two-component sensor histidine kinase
MERVQASMEVALGTGKTDKITQRYPIPIRDRPGQYVNRWWQVSHSPIYDGDKIVGVLQHSKDITEHVTSVRDASIRERLINRMSDIAFWEFCPTQGTAIVSAAQSRMFELSHRAGITSALPFIERYVPEDRARLITDFAALEDAEPGTSIEGEYRIKLPDGSIRWLLLRGDLVRENASDPASFVGVSMDVTRAHDREAALANALAERDHLLEQKELLLDEVNHRIKNSLQIVSSILNLDANIASGSEAKARLRGAAARVQAVAAVHELIYKAGQVTTVEISGYLESLCRTSEASAQSTIFCEFDDIRFSTDKAINMALLVNELVANALGHAFGDRTDGHIAVVGKRLKNEMVLTVTDDGVGKNAAAGTGLGTRVIAAMVMQLDGMMEEGPPISSSSREIDQDDGPQRGHRVLVRIPVDY